MDPVLPGSPKEIADGNHAKNQPTAIAAYNTTQSSSGKKPKVTKESLCSSGLEADTVFISTPPNASRKPKPAPSIRT